MREMEMKKKRIAGSLMQAGTCSLFIVVEKKERGTCRIVSFTDNSIHSHFVCRALSVQMDLAYVEATVFLFTQAVT